MEIGKAGRFGICVLIGFSCTFLYRKYGSVNKIVQKGFGKDVEHQDEERVNVGRTAYAVSLVRALETLRTDRKPLMTDRVAVALFDGTLGSWARLTLFVVKSAINYASFLVPYRFKEAVELLAVRTKYIDEAITKELSEKNVKQLVIVGAGLDARALRLEGLLVSHGVKVFEIDFDSMLQMKQVLFKRAGCELKSETKTLIRYVAGDLSLQNDEWAAVLKSTGFDPDQKSVWLLEGLTSYLSEQENEHLFTKITSLSQVGSSLIATWLPPHSKLLLPIHRSTCSDANKTYLAPLGWSNIETVTLGNCSARYLEQPFIPRSYDEYYFTVHRFAI